MIQNGGHSNLFNYNYSKARNFTHKNYKKYILCQIFFYVSLVFLNWVGKKCFYPTMHGYVPALQSVYFKLLNVIFQKTADFIVDIFNSSLLRCSIICVNNSWYLFNVIQLIFVQIPELQLINGSCYRKMWTRLQLKYKPKKKKQH